MNLLFADFVNSKRYRSWPMKSTLLFDIKFHNSGHEIMKIKSLHNRQLIKTYEHQSLKNKQKNDKCQ